MASPGLKSSLTTLVALDKGHHVHVLLAAALGAVANLIMGAMILNPDSRDILTANLWSLQLFKYDRGAFI